MPAVRQRINSFEKFANSALNEIYSESDLLEALQLEINELQSAVLLNDGTGKFEFRPLPELAQISPGYGVEFVFANDDPHPDICLAQNFFTPQRETTRMAAGVGCVLLGDGAGNFNEVWPFESGFMVSGDGKGLARIDRLGTGRLSVLVAQNNGNLLCFDPPTQHQAKTISVQLQQATANNKQAIGARIKLELQDGTTQAAEVYGGSSYLSQSSTAIEFCLGDSSVRAIEIIWPDGGVSKPDVIPMASGKIVLTRTENPSNE